jgi:NADH dehydrogenase FAD-containing subunit
VNQVIATRTPLNKIPRSFDAEIDSNKKPAPDYKELAKLAVLGGGKSGIRSASNYCES